jgi:serine/threonine-protein kinase
MSKFLSRFKKEKNQHEIDNSQQNVDSNQQEVESDSSPASTDGDKSEDERVAEFLKAINASESFDYLREEGEDVETQDEEIQDEETPDEETQEKYIIVSPTDEEDETFEGDSEEQLSEETDEYEDDEVAAVATDGDDVADEDDEYEPLDDEYEPEDDEYDYMNMGYEEDYTDNLSVAERAMRDNEFSMPVSSDSYRDTESFDSGEVKRRNRTSPRPRPPRNDYEIPRNTNRRKGKRGSFIVILLILLVALGAGIFAYWQYTNIEVPDLVGTELEAHRAWESNYQITLEPIFEYSLLIDEGVIMNQDHAPGSQIRRGGVIRITVSRGVDLNELIEVPNFEGMTIEEIRNWIEVNQLSDVSINQEYSDVIIEGRFIRMEFPGVGVSEANFTRQDTLRIYMSGGIEIFPANISVPNFVGRRLADVEEWALEHDITVHYVETTSNTVPSESIIDQSVEAGTMVAIRSEITVTISQGPLVVIPNFDGMSEGDARNLPGHLSIIIRNRYHPTILYGEMISQSEEPGTEFIGEGAEVIVYYSMGRPYLESLVGEQENVIEAIFFDFTSHGANITYRIIQTDSHLPRGRIIEMSHYNQWMEMEAIVDIWVSRGNLEAPPPTPPPTPPSN